MRSIARDIGEVISCGAHLSKLIRVEVEPYPITRASTVEEIKKGDFEVIKMNKALPHISSITLGNEGVWNFTHGGKVRGFYPEGLYQVKDHQGNLLGIGKGETYAIQPVKVFYSP